MTCAHFLRIEHLILKSLAKFARRDCTLLDEQRFQLSQKRLCAGEKCKCIGESLSSRTFRKDACYSVENRKLLQAPRPQLNGIKMGERPDVLIHQFYPSGFPAQRRSASASRLVENLDRINYKTGHTISSGNQSLSYFSRFPQTGFLGAFLSTPSRKR